MLVICVNESQKTLKLLATTNIKGLPATSGSQARRASNFFISKSPPRSQFFY